MKDWKAKLESAYSFMLKYSKITVCSPSREDAQDSDLAHFFRGWSHSKELFSEIKPPLK